MWYLSDLYAGRSRCLYGVQKYIFNEQTELIFLTGGLLQVLETSGDLQVKMLMFPKEAFLNAMLPIDTPYFNYTHEHPCYHHTADERSQKTWRQINCGWIWHKCFFAVMFPRSGSSKSIIPARFADVAVQHHTGKAVGREAVQP